MSPLRRRAAVLRRLVAAGLAIGLGVVSAGCSSDPVEPEAACVLAVRYDGATYVGGPPWQKPPYSDRTVEAVLPACNDQSDQPAGDDNVIEVRQIAGVPPSVALYWPAGGTVLVREGATLPPSASVWADRPDRRDGQNSRRTR